ncbi:MAG: hypothetical protein ABSH28_00560 [Acidobacteriota bacterium]|jgi:hypothetical protein
MSVQKIDLDKLRAAIRILGDESVYLMLAEAIDMLPPTKLEKLASHYLNPAQLRPDGESRGSLLEDVKAFEKASLHGDYYESFDVNWKNSTEMSKGTRGWIAEFCRLLDRCTAQAMKSDFSETRAAIEICFGLLRRIDECGDDVIFFADEGGAWQVGVDWGKVLPAWFVCLSATAEPREYGRRVVEIIEEFDKSNREKHISAAQRAATADQRIALRAAQG